MKPVKRTGLFLTNWLTLKSASRRKATTSSGKTEPLIEMSISNRGTLSNPVSDPVERQMRPVIIGHLIDGLRAS